MKQLLKDLQAMVAGNEHFDVYEWECLGKNIIFQYQDDMNPAFGYIQNCNLYCKVLIHEKDGFYSMDLTGLWKFKKAGYKIPRSVKNGTSEQIVKTIKKLLDNQFNGWEV